MGLLIWSYWTRSNRDNIESLHLYCVCLCVREGETQVPECECNAGNIKKLQWPRGLKCPCNWTLENVLQWDETLNQAYGSTSLINKNVLFIFDSLILCVVKHHEPNRTQQCVHKSVIGNSSPYYVCVCVWVYRFLYIVGTEYPNKDGKGMEMD